MKFHVTFTYQPADREKLLRLLHEGGLKQESSVRITGAWISVATGTGFVIVETKDAKAFYELCSTWSEYGAISVTPIVSVSDI